MGTRKAVELTVANWKPVAALVESAGKAAACVQAAAAHFGDGALPLPFLLLQYLLLLMLLGGWQQQLNNQCAACCCAVVGMPFGVACNGGVGPQGSGGGIGGLQVDGMDRGAAVIVEVR